MCYQDKCRPHADSKMATLKTCLCDVWTIVSSHLSSVGVCHVIGHFHKSFQFQMQNGFNWYYRPAYMTAIVEQRVVKTASKVAVFDDHVSAITGARSRSPRIVNLWLYSLYLLQVSCVSFFSIEARYELWLSQIHKISWSISHYSLPCIVLAANQSMFWGARRCLVLSKVWSNANFITTSVGITSP